MTNDETVIAIDAESMPASELGRMLVDLDKAFSAFVRSRTGGRSVPALRVGAVREGSIELVLDVGALLAAGQFLAPFATHLGQVVQVAIGLDVKTLLGVVSAPERKAIQSMANPVSKGHAKQVNIINQGTVVLNIGNAKAARLILDGLKSLDMRDVMLAERPMVPRPLVSRAQLEDLQQGTLMGTIYLVDGTWYARLEGLQGVMVPMTGEASAMASLKSGHAFQLRGRERRGVRGETVGIHIDGAKRIGK